MTPPKKEKRHYLQYVDPYEKEKERRGVEERDYSDCVADLCNFDKNF